MKRDDMNIDEILRKYLPRASQDEVDAAGDTVLKRIHEMRFQAEAPVAQDVKSAPDADWLHDFHVAVLMAVDELQGYGHPASIALRMEEILGDPVVSSTGVFLNLLLMERMGMVSSSRIDSQKPGELDKRHYAITESGRETLREALAIRQRSAARVKHPLKGFA